MKDMVKRIAVLILTVALGLSMCSCNDTGKNSESISGGSSSSSMVMPPENDDKKLNYNLFRDPLLDDLPMVQMHAPSKGLIDDVYRRGYGGIVMNVAWGSDYLNNARAWTNFASCVEYAVEKGMHVWIYDEYGYPSGAAYGNTLKGNPEYEALGLVPSYKTIPAGQSGTVELIYGHTRIEAAYVYDGTSQSDMDLSSGTDVSNLISSDGRTVTYVNRTGTDKVLAGYMSKRWYENTHSMENWYAQQRYINMLLPEPTQKFLSITHEKYYEAVGELFGKGVVAFFTDEPALQGNYFTISDRNRQVLDVPDMNIPIVESLNFSDRLFDDFKNAYGYDLKQYLGYLYNDDGSALAKQVRIDFYALTGELFRSNYLGQTADWCDAHGVKSSGHLLLEETLYQNPWFAGNMIQLLGTMGIPGTDLLYSTARRAAQDSCVVSKMASSAADFLGKTDTFAEISGAFDGTAGDMYSQLNAVGVQIAMGINTFSSYYYQGNNHTAEEDKIFSAAIGRMRYMTTGSTHKAKVAVYYPYEGVSAETLPTKNMWQPTATALEISSGFSDVCTALTNKQVDYDLFDHVNLGKCKVENGKLVTPLGEEFSAIVVPFTTALRSDAAKMIMDAKKAGVEVILVGGIDQITCEKGGNSVAKQFNEAVGSFRSVTSGTAAAKWLKQNGYTYASLSDDFASDVYITKRDNANYSVFTVVNGYMDEKSYSFNLQANGSSVQYFDSVTGEITDIKAAFSNGTASFSFTLPANRTGFFVVNK